MYAVSKNIFVHTILHFFPKESSSHSHPLFVGQCWVDKLAVEDTGALGVGRQQPDHEGNL